MNGILFGLLAALLQSLSYLVSAAFVRRHADRPSPSTALVARSYLAMGAFAALCLPPIFRLYAGRIPPLSKWWLLAIGCIATNMVAQVAMFFTLKLADASRISPLTGVKILFLALLGMAFRGDTFAPLQWGGIALAIASAALLSRNGGRLGPAGLAGILVCSMAYAGSDFFIRLQQEVFTDHAKTVGNPLPTVLANLVIVWMDYAVGSVLALAVLPFTGRYPARVWPRHVLPYALVWFSAMCFLYLAFDLLGVVHGTIVQNTRGILSILLGYAVARLGGAALERRLDRGTQLVRFAAGLAMFFAIVLFALGRS